MDLYDSYAEAYGEMSRRLEEHLPDDPARRALWVDRLFTPLSGRILDVMRSEGLDLRLPDGQVAPLTTPQKAALAEQFRWISEGLRSASRAR
jgi:hypothetical protein